MQFIFFNLLIELPSRLFKLPLRKRYLALSHITLEAETMRPLINNLTLINLTKTKSFISHSFA